MKEIDFFKDPNLILQINEVASLLMANNKDEKNFRLGQMLKFISNNPSEYDDNCQINIKLLGSMFVEYLGKVKGGSGADVDLLTALVYRIILELDLSVRRDMSFETRRFLKLAWEVRPTLTEEARNLIEASQQGMPIAILKEILNSDEVGNLRNVAIVSKNFETKIAQLEKDLTQKELEAQRLGAILEQHTQSFNFVGIHEGFNDLSKLIIKERYYARFGIFIFGLLVLAPSGLELWQILIKGLDLSKIGFNTILAGAIGVITLTLLFLYFFRIALRKADSCSAQLLQVRLRMSLCRFIQNYAEYSSVIKVKNSDALGKFESLIFSGIVVAEDKLPSTFDGLEQLSALAKSIRGSKD